MMELKIVMATIFDSKIRHIDEHQIKYKDLVNYFRESHNLSQMKATRWLHEFLGSKIKGSF